MRRRCGERIAAAAMCGGFALAALAAAPGENPHPVRLSLPAVRPLSAMARLGRRLFYDPSLSASGRQSCASCHDPSNAYGPPNALPAQYGGPALDRQGLRPPPSLEYLERQPGFSIGPDNEENENVNLQRLAAQAAGLARPDKQAGRAPAAPAMVPQGGFFWDGRADTLQAQAYGPLLNPAEMANPSADAVAHKLDHAQYRNGFERLFGARVYDHPKLLVAEATFALARYQFEDPSFHPYDSKFDAWLEGRARLDARELRGYRLFNDPRKGNCAACHLDAPSPNGLPPLFTDHQYEALAVPRNPEIAANRDPRFHDLGVCGPLRTDMAAQTRYCGMFLTPTLRNAARRKVFFHNGVYRSLARVLAFYDFRAAAPWRVYPRDRAGRLLRYDDLPRRYWGNVDTSDAPFDRKPGTPPPLSARDMRDLVAFLETLNDGWKP